MQSLNYLGSAFTFSALIYHLRYLHFLETFDCYPSLLSCNDNDVYKPMTKTFLYLQPPIKLHPTTTLKWYSNSVMKGIHVFHRNKHFCQTKGLLRVLRYIQSTMTLMWNNNHISGGFGYRERIYREIKACHYMITWCIKSGRNPANQRESIAVCLETSALQSVTKWNDIRILWERMPVMVTDRCMEKKNVALCADLFPFL